MSNSSISSPSVSSPSILNPSASIPPIDTPLNNTSIAAPTHNNELHPALSSLIQTALTETTAPLHIPFYSYTLQSRVVITGIGADELCGGYTRYQAAYNQGGYEASWRQCAGDWDRLWYRNLVEENNEGEA